MLKHLPEKLLNKIKKTLLYSNKPVYYNRATIERRRFNSTMVADITNLNNEQRMSGFRTCLKANIFTECLFAIFAISTLKLSVIWKLT